MFYFIQSSHALDSQYIQYFQISKDFPKIFVLLLACRQLWSGSTTSYFLKLAIWTLTTLGLGAKFEL